MKVLYYSDTNSKFYDPHRNTFIVSYLSEYHEILDWMKITGVDHNLLWVNYRGIVFRVSSTHIEWFILRWL